MVYMKIVCRYKEDLPRDLRNTSVSKKLTSYHEAGHLWILYINNEIPSFVQIIEDKEINSWEGHCEEDDIIYDPKQHNLEENIVFFNKKASLFAAGMITEKKALKEVYNHDVTRNYFEPICESEDEDFCLYYKFVIAFAYIKKIDNEVADQEVWGKTSQVIDTNWSKIETLAQEIEKREYLRKEDLVGILSQ